MNLSHFIAGHAEQILDEWEAVSRTTRSGEDETPLLRGMAKQVLQGVALELYTEGAAQDALLATPEKSPATNIGQVCDAITLPRIVEEYRALRVSVVRMWQHQQQALRART